MDKHARIPQHQLAPRLSKVDPEKEFTYEKTLVKCQNTGEISIAWNVKWKDEFMVRVATIKEADAYVKEKVEL